MKHNNFIFIISSPSGAGKTTIAKALLEKRDDMIMSVSATTRPRREREVEGFDYHFVDDTAFKELLDNNELLEHAKVFGNDYGTPKKPVIAALESGKDVLFDIDWQGTKQMKESMKNRVISIYILPPSMPELESRLRHRNEDSEEVIQERMSKAQAEISHWESYDYVVVNRHIEDCLGKIEAILKAERIKRAYTNEFVDKLLNYTLY